MRLLDDHDLQDPDLLLLFSDLIENSERPSNMQSIELELQMQQLFVTTLAGKGILGKFVALILDDPLALLRKI